MTHRTNHALAVAECCIVAGEQRVAQQIARIQRLSSIGYGTAEAELFLEALETSLTVLYSLRQLFLDEQRHIWRGQGWGGTINTEEKGPDLRC
jgi:hypothetical protein